MATVLENATNLYMEGIRDGRPKYAIENYTGDRYTQHSTGVKDGREGFLEFFTGFLERNPVRDIRVIRGWQDGRYAFVHVYQSLNDGEWEYVTTDFFDSDGEGKIVEHWDVIAQCKGTAVIDGSSEVTDLHKTDENKKTVQDMLRACLFNGARAENIADFIADDYIQHNTEVPDGLEAFAKLAQAENRPLNYDEIVLCVGQGNFVATLCKANWEGKPLAQVDVFRLENGKIVEHWDNSEPVPENDVNSGKF